MVDRNFGGAGYANINGGSNFPEDHQSQNIKETNPPAFTMPGILFWIQEEWNKLAMQRIQWKLEKAEYMAQISNLQGERKGQENVKMDLVRRIKMLEYALKEERHLTEQLRSKQLNSTSTKSVDENSLPSTVDHPEPPSDSGTETKHSEQRISNREENNTGVPRCDKEAQKALLACSTQWQESMQRLKNYLVEVGYNESLLDVRHLRLNHAMDAGTGATGTSEPRFAGFNRVMATLQDSSDAVMDTFAFLDEEAGGDKFHAEERDDAPNPGAPFNDNAFDSPRQENSSTKSSSLKQVIANLESPHRGNLAGDQSKPDSLSKQPWSLRHTLRGHWDSVRTVAFHSGHHHALLSGSDEGCVLLWNLEPDILDAVSSRVWMTDSGENECESGTVVEVQPVHCIRAHDGPVLCSLVESLSSSTGTVSSDSSLSCLAFTGGVDSTLRMWSLPHASWTLHEDCESEEEDEQGMQEEPLQTHDISKTPTCVYLATEHKDAVWCLASNSSCTPRSMSSTALLASGAADGTVKLWSYTSFSHTLGGMQCEHTCVLANHVPAAVSGDVPVSVAFQAGGTRLLVATRNALLVLMDVETGQVLFSQSLATKDSLDVSLYSLAVHNTLPLAVAGLENGHVCFFDTQEASIIYDCVAHQDAVASLAFEPQGLYFATAGMDESVRLWDVGSRACVQAMHAHRSKNAESALSVAFHSHLPLMASSGADAVVKVYSSAWLA